MAFLVTEISDDVTLMLECETTGAFSKSDMEVRPNPLMAFRNSLDMIGKIGVAFAEQVGPAMAAADAEMDVKFGVKVDGQGAVMVSMRSEECQFNVTMRFSNRS